MPHGQRIVVPFHRLKRGIGEATALLSSACGRVVTDSRNIPINFDIWPKVPKSYKEACFNISKELCRKNTEARKKQTIPHTGGSKLLSRTHHEMEVELGRVVGRGELYIATHKKKDGSYVNEEARSIVEKVMQEISQSVDSAEISTNNVVAKVLGKDHPGRVRCLGLGGLHSVAFPSATRFSGVGCSHSSYSSTESSQLKEEVLTLKTKLAVSEENVKTLQNVMLAYIQMKEGHIPAELGALLSTSTNSMDEVSGQDMTTPQEGSSLASNRH